MYKSYKVEIKADNKFIHYFNKSKGVCRFVYNMYIDTNIKLYEDFNTKFDEYLSDNGLIFEDLSKLEIKKLKDKFKKDNPTIRSFISGYDFSKKLNNEIIPQNKNYKWINEISSKAIKQSIMESEKAFKEFFKNGKGYP